MNKTSRWVDLLVLAIISSIASYAVFAASPAFASSNVTAKTWLYPLIEQPHALHLNEIKQQSDLYDCGIEQDDEEFCSDEIWYNKTPVKARMFINQHDIVNSMTLKAEFNASAFTDIQLSLRKDGFYVSEVYKLGKRFSVEEQQELFDERTLDQKLIQFINQGVVSDPIEVRWRHQQSVVDSKNDVFAQLSSNGEFIEVVFSHNNQSPLME
ncbi:hypothetical protein [uncultured Vibrio sp.]|uniref:hypothetical protein n=1 Tax=uncultured Vibrio sp. TaxID=114054 RepID=UPI0025D6E13D|nr:hypothetical protein [uncultured Vibrio sp.]